MAKNIVEIGPEGAPLYAFSETEKDLRSLSFVNNVDISGSQLAIDTMTQSVFYPYDEGSSEIVGGMNFYGVLSSDGYFMGTNKAFFDIRSIPYATPIRYYRDGRLYARMYVKSIDRVGVANYRINAISGVGLWAAQKHAGGFYNGRKFADVLADITGGPNAGVPYVVDGEVGNLTVHGYLPYQSKRDNLHMLLFSLGVMVGRYNGGGGNDGVLHFRFPSNKSATQIQDTNVYTGGTVDYSAPVTGVDITEHSYFALDTDETVTIYDNTDGSETANGTVIVFRDAPLHDVQGTENLIIHRRHANYAIISGTGKLTGKKYTHSTRVLSKKAENRAQQTEKIASVTDNTMVTVANSENVAKRVLSYYSSKKTVTLSFANKGERCGDMVTGIDPYGDAISGFIVALNGNVSNVIKTSGKVVTGYTPTGQGNNYSQTVTLTGSGTWEVPAWVRAKDVPVIQAVLISGGHGGYSGEDGKAGKGGGSAAFGAPDNQPGEGGAGGGPGEGGRIFVVTINVSQQSTIPYSCGVGGESDNAGGDTTFSYHSSASGSVSATGVSNIFTGAVFARPGTKSGIKGGRGDPDGETVTYNGQTWTTGPKGADDSMGRGHATGGYGGGPAYGRNGYSGRDGEVEHDYSGVYDAYGGKGGDGATPLPADNATGIGEGGPGGHGGGGPGAGGEASSNGQSYASYGGPGSPGKGGLGGRGGPGGIIIYM